MRNRQGVLYLLDFGAVKQITAGGGNPKKSTGIFSMGFAPPEQMSGAQIYPSTDIYALAVTCLNLLTGKEVEELYDSFNHTWQWHSFVPNISDRLKQILDKMLLPTPAHRFQSAREAIEAFAVQPQQISTVTLPIKPTLVPKQNQSLVAKASATPVAQKMSPKMRQKRIKRPFSLAEVLSSAAFLGFEGALISIGLISWLAFSGESLGIIGAVMGGIMFALHRRTIEKVDLVIFALITASVVIFIPKFHGTLTTPNILIIATISAAAAIAITAFFRLVHQLLSRLL
jgi:serine/threonine-protein kinase